MRLINVVLRARLLFRVEHTEGKWLNLRIQAHSLITVAGAALVKRTGSSLHALCGVKLDA